MSSVLNFCKILGSLFFCLLAFSSYFFSSYLSIGVPQFLVTLVASSLALALFFWTKLGLKLLVAIQDSYLEVSKVVWPSRKETLQLTLVVFCFVFVLAVYLAVVDALLRWVLYSLVLGWSGS